MSARTLYFKDRIIPKIINLFKKEGINITNENIKIWGCDTMLMKNVATCCDKFKNEGKSILIYTNIVPNIEYIEKDKGITIYDQNKLGALAMKWGDYEMCDMIA